MAEQHQLISPFEPKLVRHVDGRRIISAGASSYGYDMRLADDGFRVFSPIHGREIDPKAFDDESLVEPPLRTAEDGSKYYLLSPHSYALGVTVETFHMPRNVTGIAMGPVSFSVVDEVVPRVSFRFLLNHPVLVFRGLLHFGHGNSCPAYKLQPRMFASTHIQSK